MVVHKVHIPEDVEEVDIAKHCLQLVVAVEQPFVVLEAAAVVEFRAVAFEKAEVQCVLES